MNRKRNLAVSLTAAALAAALVYGVYELQLRQIDLQETVRVVVPVRFIPAGERLTEKELGWKAIAKASFEPGMLRSMDQAAGMETAIPIGEGEPILDWKLDRFRLLPNRDELTFQIPKAYVLSVSSGIRAGDRVMLYVSGEGAVSERLFDAPVTVASVKTSANLEIDDPQNSNLLSMASGNRERMYASRRDANGTIDVVNLNLTEEQWLRIDGLVKDGKAKLVVAFSPESPLSGRTGGNGS
ncbi:MAG TPA: SAF domain-containing protein [Paenibacillus sp.]|uniref:SAF domain-containing protein n=1 Tax=Paenibacillus sp. TaxID=58172 RepID=UPI0028D6BCAA|nr:SAF domain-containing protein [Paenibacillus sp.]HUC93052.1 SAF domain-containing protein [Paenibacillus sp.]